ERTARRSTSAAGVSGSRNGGPLTPRHSTGPPRSPTPDPGPSNGTTGTATAGRPRPETAGAPDIRRRAGRPGRSPEYARDPPVRILDLVGARQRARIRPHGVELGDPDPADHMVDEGLAPHVLRDLGVHAQ